MNSQFKKLYKSDEENLYEVKRKTIPFEQSLYGRSPLHKPYISPTKQYSDVEIQQQQAIYKENYLNPRLSFMKDSLEVLKKLRQLEGK